MVHSKLSIPNRSSVATSALAHKFHSKLTSFSKADSRPNASATSRCPQGPAPRAELARCSATGCVPSAFSPLSASHHSTLFPALNLRRLNLCTLHECHELIQFAQGGDFSVTVSATIPRLGVWA